MRLVPHIIVRTGLGVAIAGTALAVLLPWLIRAGYLALGSRNALWVIGLMVVTCVALALCLAPRSDRAEQRPDE
jgi:hypothetical protein